MLRTLIVDDEPLVRKGIISLMPWKKYGLEVVGEANNGLVALELLRESDIDVLFTDVMMPEMNGLELIKDVRNLYPHIMIIVLTCYEDFNFIQDAMRHEVADYILKTELELGRMDEILQRIIERQQPKSYSKPRVHMKHKKTGLLFYSANGNALPHAIGNELEQALLYVISSEAWLFLFPALSEMDECKLIERSKLDGISVVLIHDLEEGTHTDILRLFTHYVNHELFYMPPSDHHYMSIHAGDIKREDRELPQELVQRWSSLTWSYQETEYQYLLSMIEELRPSGVQLRHLFEQALTELKRYFFITEDSYSWRVPSEGLKCWPSWKIWIDDVRLSIKKLNANKEFPAEIVDGIFRVIEYMQRQKTLNFRQEELAARANMSRGYFSYCFKLVMGKSFSDYVRDLRLFRAKELLAKTNSPIYWIAETIGFNDERYFSQFFSKFVGMSPSKYRSMMGSK